MIVGEEITVFVPLGCEPLLSPSSLLSFVSTTGVASGACAGGVTCTM